MTPPRRTTPPHPYPNLNPDPCGGVSRPRCRATGSGPGLGWRIVNPCPRLPRHTVMRLAPRIQGLLCWQAIRGGGARGEELSHLVAHRHIAADMEAFEREHAGPWLVWEAGRWRPPPPDRCTLATPGERTGRSSSGDALALQVSPRPGRARFEGVRLGRGPDNDLVVDDGTLSRAHLLLRLEDGRWTIEDLRSSNGTRVDGAVVDGTPVPIDSGASIEAGSVRFTFYDAKGLYLRLRHGVV